MALAITRTSTLTGITRTRTLNVTAEELQKYHDGALVQDVFGHLSDDDREFLISGITHEEWVNAFGGVY